MAVKMTTSEDVRVDSTGKSGNCGLTGILLLSLEQLGDLVTDLTVGHLDIILGVTVIVHEGEVSIIGDIELER